MRRARHVVPTLIAVVVMAGGVPSPRPVADLDIIAVAQPLKGAKQGDARIAGTAKNNGSVGGKAQNGSSVGGR